MKLCVLVAGGLLAGPALSMAACGSSNGQVGGPPGGSHSGSGSGGGSPGTGSGSGSGSSPLVGTAPPSSGTVASGSGPADGSVSGSGIKNLDSGMGSDSVSSNFSSDGANGSGASDGDSAACVMGQVQPSEVVMLGDSYLDPAWGNVGPTLMMEANASYRPYYIGAASVNGGIGQFNIPYQFDSMAVPDNPDIKVVITDGGGNDILVNNRQCLTTPVMGDASCHTVIDDVLSKTKDMLADMASKGVEHIVYFFYPHIDTSALFTGPDANDWLDYAYPLAAQACCAAGALPAAAPDLTCHGSQAPGVDCTFIDTRPEFAGHNDPNEPSNYWLDSLGIHPTQQGADVIANKVWGQMQKYCIAQ